MTALIVLAGYLLGSIPFSVLFALLWGRVDLRHIGSGNPGGMNTLRAVGRVPGIAAVLLDVAKGAGAVLLAKWLLAGDWGPALAGAAAVLGHCYSAFLILLFLWERRTGKQDQLPWWQAQPRLGGKGLASGIGVLLALSLPAFASVIVVYGLATLVLFLLGIRGSPLVAQGSTVALLSAPIFFWAWEQSLPYAIGGLLTAIVAAIKHVPYLELGPKWPNAHLERITEPTEPQEEASTGQDQQGAPPVAQ
jgi:glycerol-3-phosphate acyltransferase PlsY